MNGETFSLEEISKIKTLILNYHNDIKRMTEKHQILIDQTREVLKRIGIQDLTEKEDSRECPTCKKVFESRPTPDGDEICPNCGDNDCMDYEGDEQLLNEGQVAGVEK